MRDLEWVEIQNPDTKLCSIDGMLYSRNGKNLYFCARTGAVEIPDGTKLSAKAQPVTVCCQNSSSLIP